MTKRHLSQPGRRGSGLALGTLLAIVLAALAPAVAEARPRITKAPVVTGTPYVGTTLQAQGAEWTPKSRTVASWQWMRCDSVDDDSCRSINGARSTSYTVVTADLGKRLRVLLMVREYGGDDDDDEDQWDWELSAPSAVVTNPPPPPPPAPEPEPEPEPEPSPQVPSTPSNPSTPGPTASGPATPAAGDPAPAGPAPAGDVRTEQASAPRMMSPAPVVRIRGRLTRSGARITLLTVRAPRGAAITVRCFGRGCPARRWARAASLTRVTRFQAALRAGTRLVISVTRPGRIGKHTTIVIRRGKAPTRRDRCLMPGTGKPVSCPAV